MPIHAARLALTRSVTQKAVDPSMGPALRVRALRHVVILPVLLQHVLAAFLLVAAVGKVEAGEIWPVVGHGCVRLLRRCHSGPRTEWVVVVVEVER